MTMKVITLSDEQATALLSSFDSAAQGRDDFEYLLAQNGEDYTQDDIRRARRRHKSEVTVEKTITQQLRRTSESRDVVALRSALCRVVHAAFADSNDDEIEKLADALQDALAGAELPGHLETDQRPARLTSTAHAAKSTTWGPCRPNRRGPLRFAPPRERRH